MGQEARIAVAPPASEVGNDDVRSRTEVHLGLVQDDPAPWAAPSPIERLVQEASQVAGYGGVTHARSRSGVEHTVEDLCHLIPCAPGPYGE